MTVYVRERKDFFFLFSQIEAFCREPVRKEAFISFPGLGESRFSSLISGACLGFG